MRTASQALEVALGLVIVVWIKRQQAASFLLRTNLAVKLAGLPPHVPSLSQLPAAQALAGVVEPRSFCTRERCIEHDGATCIGQSTYAVTRHRVKLHSLLETVISGALTRHGEAGDW